MVVRPASAALTLSAPGWSALDELIDVVCWTRWLTRRICVIRPGIPCIPYEDDVEWLESRIAARSGLNTSSKELPGDG